MPRTRLPSRVLAWARFPPPAEYGQSTFSHMTGQRLAQAHALLSTDSVPMKLLAARLGYSHVNHFISAFKKRFGYPPGSVRRKAP